LKFLALDAKTGLKMSIRIDIGQTPDTVSWNPGKESLLQFVIRQD
jgi:hypothetical protein